MKDMFLKYEDFILDEIFTIDTMFDLYIYLYNKRIDKLDELNIAPAFFDASGIAMLETSMAKLSKLYDTDKNTVTIFKYLNIIEQQTKAIFSDECTAEVTAAISKHKMELDKLSGQYEKLKSIRDVHLAHNDKKIIRDSLDIWKETGLLIGDIHGLIKWVSDVVNTYRTIRGDSYISLDATNKYDVNNVIDAITDYLKE